MTNIDMAIQAARIYLDANDIINSFQVLGFDTDGSSDTVGGKLYDIMTKSMSLIINYIDPNVKNDDLIFDDITRYLERNTSEEIENNNSLTNEEIRQFLTEYKTSIETKEPHILIKTDGYSIETKKFNSKDEAFSQMKKEYDEIMTRVTIEDFKIDSNINDTDATAYANGEDVFVWKIVKL